LVSQAILYNVRLKTDLLAGGVLHKRDFNVAHPVCDEGAIGSAPQLRDNLLHNGNLFTSVDPIIDLLSLIVSRALKLISIHLIVSVGINYYN
jgi:hypothetical protein